MVSFSVCIMGTLLEDGKLRLGEQLNTESMPVLCVMPVCTIHNKIECSISISFMPVACAQVMPSDEEARKLQAAHHADATQLCDAERFMLALTKARPFSTVFL